MTGKHGAKSGNLTVLGYVRPNSVKWIHYPLYIVGYQAFKDIVSYQPMDFFWLGLVGALVIYAVSRNGIHTWFDADGKRKQDFRPDRQRYPLWRHFVAIEREVLLREFMTERLRDPKLGELRCAFYEDAPTAYAGNRIVFRVLSKSEYSGMTGQKAVGWRAAHRVEADPRLDPDTVEYLVEKFAIMNDESALNLRLKSRQVEIDRERAQAAARA